MRGDFADLLDETLLFTASPRPRPVQPVFPLIPLAGGRPDVARGEDPSRRKIWQFELNGLDAVRNVTVRVRSMRDMQMSVCREVRWGEVKVTYQGRTLRLPLTERFLLRTYYLPDGTVPESSSGYWQLPMNLEQSFQRIFGFQLRAGQFQPLSGAELETRGLMAPPSPESMARARGGQGGSVLRVLVCMALGCAKERNDFEPGGVMGAARLIPHLMLVANLPVESMLVRLLHGSQLHPHALPHVEQPVRLLLDRPAPGHRGEGRPPGQARCPGARGADPGSQHGGVSRVAHGDHRLLAPGREEGSPAGRVRQHPPGAEDEIAPFGPQEDSQQLAEGDDHGSLLRA